MWKRTYFLMSQIEGKKYQEIADEIGPFSDTVDQTLYETSLCTVLNP